MSQFQVNHNLPTDTDQHQGNRGYNESMDERTHRKTGHKPQQPQNYQYESYRPQHVILLSIICVIEWHLILIGSPFPLGAHQSSVHAPLIDPPLMHDHPILD
jgi:hypothetical protein